MLDEVQMLPVYFLTPILDVLRQLCVYYGVTVVLCTATQPDFESSQSFEGLPNIQELREHFNYAEVAQAFRMIDDTSTPVIVTYKPASDRIENLFDRLRKAGSAHREDLRALQPYIVNLSKYEFDKAKEHCLVTEIIPGVWRWNEQEYDSGKDGKHGQGILLDGMLSADNFLW